MALVLQKRKHLLSDGLSISGRQLLQLPLNQSLHGCLTRATDTATHGHSVPILYRVMFNGTRDVVLLAAFLKKLGIRMPTASEFKQINPKYITDDQAIFNALMEQEDGNNKINEWGRAIKILRPKP